jgi:hypothetical protein
MVLFIGRKAGRRGDDRNVKLFNIGEKYFYEFKTKGWEKMNGF